MNNVYSFVSAEEDVDFIRIVREAPKDTQFILVETRTRQNQAKESTLLVNNDVLRDERVQGYPLADLYVENSVRPDWGHSDSPDTNGKLYSYRYWAFQGAFPGKVRKQVDNIKRALNPKDTKTIVTLL
jgi:hypothetical protein